MTAWQDFKAAVVGKPLRLIRREFDWVFEFGEAYNINVSTLWRIKSGEGIRLTSGDDGHKYGLPAPVDAEKWSQELLKGAAVESIDDDALTADVRICLSNGLVVEFLTNSSGYESWQAYIDGELATVGLNGG